MDVIPSNIIFDIFSREPAKCLARSRCVSKVWCEYIIDPYLMLVHDERDPKEPIPILHHSHLDGRTRSLCFHVLKSKQTGTTHTYVLDPKEDPFSEFLRKNPLSKSSYMRTEVRGSCNGLMCLSRDEYIDYGGDLVTTLIVVHPLRRKCYELPPLPMRWVFGESCGLGFDASTNTLKMVCVLCNPNVVKKNLCTMVHVFGTNSWREIPQVPPYPTKGKVVFANACLHWLVDYRGIKTKDVGTLVICFDVEKEEFGLIGSPKKICYSDHHLVDVNGEVRYVCFETLEVWVLKQKEWVPHCRFEKQNDPYGYIEVLGCWNKDGDMLIRNRGDGKYRFFVYNLKSGVLHETNIVIPDDPCDPNIFMHPNKLFSIHGIGTNSFPMKKVDMNKSYCQQLLCFN